MFRVMDGVIEVQKERQVQESAYQVPVSEKEKIGAQLREKEEDL